MPTTNSATGTGLVGNVPELLGAAEKAAAREKKITQNLGKDAFLQLLVTQLKSQDPMKPMEDTAFIAEMAQFTSLEQMQNLNKLMESQSAFTSLTQASGLIDKQVELLDTKTSTTIKGKVTEVRIVDGKPQLMVNGTAYPATDVTKVLGTPAPAPTGSGTSGAGA